MRNARDRNPVRRSRGAAIVVGLLVLGSVGAAACYVGPVVGGGGGCPCDTTYGCDGCGCEPVQECWSGPCYCDPTYGCDGCPCEPANECMSGGVCICDQTYGCDGCPCEPVQECI